MKLLKAADLLIRIIFHTIIIYLPIARIRTTPPSKAWDVLEQQGESAISLIQRHSYYVQTLAFREPQPQSRLSEHNTTT